MEILALDIASRTGWCTKDSHGSWNLNAKRDESKGMRLVRIRAKVKEITEAYGITMVIFEMASGRHKSSIAVESELIGVVKLFCEENKIAYASLTSSAIKKHATGKGNCGKDLMLNAAVEKFGYGGDDLDEVDAMWIYDLAKKEYGL